MDEYLAFAKDLARQAGQLILEGFNNNLDIELKADQVHSPVTQVDKAINDLVIKSIRQKYPEHGLMGEEADSGTGQEEFQWLCDPLDGTRPFIMGIPLSTFILGLTKKGQILLSVVYNPFTDQLYGAIKGKGAFCNDQPIKVNNQDLSEAAYVLLPETGLAYVEDLRKAGAQVEALPGAGYRAMLVATGRAGGIIQPLGHADFHDVGPASLIVEEAGGKATDLGGEPQRFDQPLKNGIILSNNVCHDQLLKIVKID